jgi:hypothetical protein
MARLHSNIVSPPFFYILVNMEASDQGLTLVHFLTQRKHFLWDTLAGFSDKNGHAQVKQGRL